MDLLKQLNHAVRYIEDNLAGEIDLNKAAQFACATRDSFLRFFSYMVGMTVTEYIRRRRLTLAADDLRRSGRRVFDTALQYGYDSADAFSRAFFKQHGILPAAFQKNGGPLKIYPPVSFYLAIKGAEEMDFQLIDMEETALYGISTAFDPQRYPTKESLRNSIWDKEQENIPSRLCKGEWDESSNQAYDGVWYGLWRDGRYLVAREKEHVQYGGLERQVIPAGKYAAFTSKPGGLAWEEIPRLTELVLDSWLPASGYTLRGGDVIERYHLWSDRETRRKNRYYEVWVPVQEKLS